MGMSFWKLAILAVLAWWIWRWLNTPSLPARSKTGADAAPQTARAKAVDLEKCPKCGVHVSVGSGHDCAASDGPDR